MFVHRECLLSGSEFTDGGPQLLETGFVVKGSSPPRWEAPINTEDSHSARERR
jgi:hypothetical protein